MACEGNRRNSARELFSELTFIFPTSFHRVGHIHQSQNIPFKVNGISGFVDFSSSTFFSSSPSFLFFFNEKWPKLAALQKRHMRKFIRNSSHRKRAREKEKEKKNFHGADTQRSRDWRHNPVGCCIRDQPATLKAPLGPHIPSDLVQFGLKRRLSVRGRAWYPSRLSALLPKPGKSVGSAQVRSHQALSKGARSLLLLFRLFSLVL